MLQSKGALEENVFELEGKKPHGDVSRSAVAGSVVNTEKGLTVATSFAEPRSILRMPEVPG